MKKCIYKNRKRVFNKNRNNAQYRSKYKSMQRVIQKIAIITIISLFALTGCQGQKVVKSHRDAFVLGTFISIDIFHHTKVDETFFDKLVAYLQQLDSTLTVNQEVNSVIQQVNEAAGEHEITVPEDVYSILEKGIYYSGLTNGKFDITIGALVKTWNIGFEGEDVPSNVSIEEALSHVDYKKLELTDSQVLLKEKGMQLDLGGIAKGYAADQLAMMLKDAGYERGIINLGGNIYCLGDKEGGKPYNVGVRDPNRSPSDYVGVVSLKNMTVVTSGIYERNFEKDGKIYHHILDTKTGYPVDNSLLSVAIIGKESLQADALSTGVFAMGLSNGLEFIESIEDVEAIFITKDREIYLSSGAKAIFKLTSKDYTIKQINTDK